MALTDADWLKIKNLIAQDVSITALAARFGVTYGAIWSRLRAEKEESEKKKRVVVLASRKKTPRRSAATLS